MPGLSIIINLQMEETLLYGVHERGGGLVTNIGHDA